MTDSSDNLEAYQNIWNDWSGRRSAKVTILFNLLTSWTFVLMDDISWITVCLFLLLIYTPMILLITIVPWNINVYQSKYCIDYQTIVERFDESLSEYMSSNSPLNRFTILRSYRCFSLLLVFIRTMWFLYFHESLVSTSNILYGWYIFLIILPLFESMFIWQFCNNVTKNYMNRGISTTLV